MDKMQRKAEELRLVFGPDAFRHAKGKHARAWQCKTHHLDSGFR